MRTPKTSLLLLALTSALTVAALAQDLTVPNQKDSLKFAVMGDSGTGNSDQYRLAKQLATVRQRYPFEFVLMLGDTGTGDAAQYRAAKQFATVHQTFPFEFAVMLGDNMYGGESARDFQRKFEIPYKPVLDAGVKFYASLGNHDSPNQRMYKLFNMNGERFYSFRPKAGIRFFALDSNYMDRTQLQWLEKELAASGSDWKIA